MAAIPQHILAHAALANACFARGDLAGSVEAVAAAAVLDIQQHRAGFVADASGAVQLCGLYTRGFSAALSDLPWTPPTARDGPPSVLLAAQCIADGQAASSVVLRLAADLAGHGWRVGVVVAEELTQRTPPLRVLRCPDGPSTRIGAGFLDRLREHAEVMLVPTLGSFVDGARAGVGMARAWEADLAVFVASPACPVQAGMIAARVAPVQCNLSVGVPMIMAGVDRVLYNNPRTLAAHAGVLAGRGIAAMSVATSGGDAAAGLAAPAADRAGLGVPADAVLLASASNCLPARMLAGSFARDLGALLAANPRVHWMGVGRGDFAAVRDLLAPVIRRVHLVGTVADIRPFVKAADLFLNEYPEGGGNSVIEAMGCGTPVVAMNAGPQHGCCIGAELVGEDAIATMDTAAYWARVAAWTNDPAARAEAGRRQQRRAVEELDFGPITAAYRREFEALIGRDPAAAAA